MSTHPRILCVDTSDSKLACLLAQGGQVQALAIHDGARDHCKNIITATDSLLQEEQINLSNIDGFACIIGPGSFTGLRIGMIAAKTFAYTMDKPLLGINTFERMPFKQAIEGATYLWPAQKNHAYATTKPLGDDSHFAFGKLDELQQNALHVYCPEGFETGHKQQTCLPFAQICGTSLARRLDLHWQEQRWFDITRSHPLYVQDVAATKPKARQ